MTEPRAFSATVFLPITDMEEQNPENRTVPLEEDFDGTDAKGFKEEAVMQFREVRSRLTHRLEVTAAWLSRLQEGLMGLIAPRPIPVPAYSKTACFANRAGRLRRRNLRIVRPGRLPSKR